MHLVPLGINMEGYSPKPQTRHEIFTIGYLARIAPEKGLHVLSEAYRAFRRMSAPGSTRLLVGGYLPPEHQGYLDGIRRSMRDAGLESEFEYVGELDRNQKVAFLQRLDLFSVPTTYREPKGLFLLEALASGIPAVQPRRGAFPEIIRKTGGGVIVEADDPAALAAAYHDLWRDPAKAHAIGAAGAAGVREHYDVRCMAEAAEEAYRVTTSGHVPALRSHLRAESADSLSAER
jgi:glycosyltransferase involved in cell wall biosynthesis